MGGPARRARRSRALRSSVAGSAQCRSSNASKVGWTRAPAITQASSAAILTASQFLGRDIGAARSGGSGMSTSGASSGAYSAGFSLLCCKRRLEIGEPPIGRATVRAPEALPAPIGDRVQRRVLQELRGAPLDPGVRRIAKPNYANFSIKRDLPRPGSPTIFRNWPSPGARASHRPHQHGDLFVAADHRRERRCPARRPPPLARTIR